MSERSHLSIGEVLSLLREEFPDVTISKIRFLESQGLVDPERTPSGYRKFYDHDVERLRWILRQQREHFLPLKVIRGRLTDQGEEVDELGLADEDDGRLERSEETEEVGEPATSGPTALAEPDPEARVSEPEPGQVRAAMTASTATSEEDGSLTGSPASPPAEGQPDLQPAGVTAAASAATSRRPTEAKPSTPAPRPTHVTPSLFADARSEQARSDQARSEQARSEQGRAAAPAPKPGGMAPKSGGTARRGRQASEETESYSADELATAAGATAELVAELKQFGLVSPHAVVAGTPYFDECALAVTRAAAQFAGYGVEVRHLRAWRNAADREAGLFEQIVLPLLRQRNPQARLQAAETLTDLARLGGDLRSALLDQAIRDIR
jgi:DNA-binding transcriptional MerR regulator